MDRHLLQLYADFIVKVGVNVNPGQYFLINCPVECAEFGRACAKAGFEAGAKDVIVRFHDEKLTRIRYENAAEETLAATMPYELRSWLDYAEAPGGACRLYIDADDPEAYAGLDGAKINRANTARAKALKPWTEYTMNDRLQWCVAAVPGRAWASRVFPELPTEQAVEKLWQLIFDACRVTGGDQVGEWKKHIAMLTQKKDQLNRWDLESVHFSSANGTDVTIGLADGAVWEGANSRSERGIDFIANLPTEEVFTAPHRTKVNGVVKGTRPYAYNGQLITAKWWHIPPRKTTHCWPSCWPPMRGPAISARWRWCPRKAPFALRAFCFTALCLMKTQPVTLPSAQGIPPR